MQTTSFQNIEAINFTQIDEEPFAASARLKDYITALNCFGYLIHGNYIRYMFIIWLSYILNSGSLTHAPYFSVYGPLSRMLFFLVEILNIFAWKKDAYYLSFFTE